MKESIYKTYDELPLFLNAQTVAKVLVIVVAKSAQLRFRLGRKLRSLPCSSSPHKARERLCGGPIYFPSLHRIVVPKEEFIRWVERRTGGAE